MIKVLIRRLTQRFAARDADQTDRPLRGALVRKLECDLRHNDDIARTLTGGGHAP